jgi:iron complex transport system substrate-binding protein
VTLRIRAAVPLVAAVLLISACASQPGAGTRSEAPTTAPATEAAPEPTEVTVTHAQGEATVPYKPATVLTFDLATLDTLDDLGVTVAGVPKSNLPGDLATFDSDEFVDIGTLFEPDYEAVAAAEPDLIIVAGRSSAALPELAKIAPTIDLSNDWADFRGSIEANSRVLGEIFGLQDEVEAKIADLDAKIADVSAAAEDAGTALVLLTTGGQATAFGPGSRFGFLHDDLGVTPAVEDVEAATHGEAVSWEFVAEAAPEWIFVVDRDQATGESSQPAAQILDNELVRSTPAWQNDRVVYVDPVAWYIVNGGLPVLADIADEVGAALGR